MDALIDTTFFTDLINGTEIVNISDDCDELHEYLQDELDKLHSMHEKNVVWQSVWSLCLAILERSGDTIKVYAAMLLALVYENELSEMPQAFRAFEGFLIPRWEKVSSVDKNIQVRLFDWLDSCLVARCKKLSVDQSEIDLLAEFQPVVHSVGINIGRRAGINRNVFTKFTDELLRKKESLESDFPKSRSGTYEAEPTKQSIEMVMDSGETNLEIVKSIVSTADEYAVIVRQTQKLIKQLADYHFQTENYSPDYYFLNRLSCWLPIRNLPLNTEATTVISAPSLSTSKKLFQIKEGDVAASIQNIEEVLARNPYWIDGQYLAYNFLLDLGELYTEACRTILLATKSFLTRFPELKNLRFSDQRQMVSELTLNWLQRDSDKEVCVSVASSSIGCHKVDPLGLPDIDHKSIENQGNAGEAHQASSFKIEDNVSGGREMFLVSLSLAEKYLRADKYSQACILLVSMYSSVKKFKLAHWDEGLHSRFLCCLRKLYVHFHSDGVKDVILGSKAECLIEYYEIHEPLLAVQLK